MAIRTQVTALVVLTSAALFACTAGTAGDGSTPAPNGAADGHHSPVGSVQDATKHRGRPHTPASAGRITTTAIIAKLLDGEGESSSGGSSGGGSSSGGSSGAPSYPSTVTTNTTTYAYGAPVTVSFGSMDTDPNSWVGFAPEGSPATDYGWYAYTDGNASGDAVTVADLPPGTYVARAFWGSSYEIKGESAPFTVSAPSPAPGATVAISAGELSTNEQFGGFEMIHVSFSGLTANAAYTVGVYPEFGSNSQPYTTASGTASGEGNGSAELTDLLSGVTYDVRVFEASTWKLRSSTRFRVHPSVRPVASSLGGSGPIEIEFAGMEGLSFVDKVQLAEAGGTVIDTKTAEWYWSGSVTFTRPASGSYVARIFNGVNDPTTAKASVSFEVQ
jgi:hypothetical protein